MYRTRGYGVSTLCGYLLPTRRHSYENSCQMISNCNKKPPSGPKCQLHHTATYNLCFILRMQQKNWATVTREAMAATVSIQSRFNSAERCDRSPRSVFVPRPTVGACTVVRSVAAARIARDAGVGYCRCLAVLYRACERYRRVAIKEDAGSLAGSKLVHAVRFVDDCAVVSPLVRGAVRKLHTSVLRPPCQRPRVGS